jgi:ABC-type uncharacterized transport system substrate-binding protein
MKFNYFLKSYLLSILIICVGIVFFTCKSGKSGVKSICLIQYLDSPISQESKQGIIEGLKNSEWKEGENYTFHYFNAMGDSLKLDSLVEKAKIDKYDLIMVTSSPTLQVVLKKVKEIPIVFTTVADPIAAGAGKSFKDHIPNVTGISTLGDYEGFVKILNRFIPKIKTIGTLFVPGEINSLVNKGQLLKYAEKQNIIVETVGIDSMNAIEKATNKLLKKNVQAICQVVGNLTDKTFPAEARLALKANIPIFGFTPKQVEQGAVAVLARDYVQAGKEAAELAIKILKGEDPADVPFTFVSKSNLIINKTNAKLFNINLSEDLLKQAYKVIE